MRFTYTVNTRKECVGYDENQGCLKLVNGKHMIPIDCSNCWAYEVVEDREEYWNNIIQDCVAYGSTHLIK